MRIMGLDIGSKWIGVALSDPIGILATPLTRISATPVEQTVEEIKRLISDNDVARIVAGMPYSMDGSTGHQAQRVQDFLDNLSQHVDVPIEICDERLTSVAAERRMMEAGLGRQKRRDHIDAAAAAVILQGYLDQQPSP